MSASFDNQVSALTGKIVALSSNYQTVKQEKTTALSAKSTNANTTGKTFTADTNKRWNFDTFVAENSQVKVDKTKLTANQLEYFTNYEKVANAYIARMEGVYKNNNKATPGKHKLPIAITGKMLADAALKTFVKYGNDISKVVPVELMLAQLQGETHFGTITPRKGSANSPFNVGVYDSSDASFLGKLTGPQQGIEMYFDLMAEDYLSKNSAAQLSKSFVNENNQRYASDKEYEAKMGQIQAKVKEVAGAALPDANKLKNDTLPQAGNTTPATPAKPATPTTPPASSTPKISASVGQGGKNIKADVITVQNLLNKKNAKLVVDGSCGPKTIAAITAFQKQVVKLAKPDGRIDVGGTTWKALTASTATPAPAAPKPTPAPTPAPAAKISASVGQGGKNIKADVITVQNLLNKKNAKLVVDGSCGPKTIAAITAFQKQVVKLAKPDGRIDVGGATWKALTAGTTTAAPAPAATKPATSTPAATTDPNLKLYNDTYSKGTGTISGSVGTKGTNKNNDIIIIKALLAKRKYLDHNALVASPKTLPVMNAALTAAIEKFQKEVVKLSKPDGRVDAVGQTINVLNGKAATAPAVSNPTPSTALNNPSTVANAKVPTATQINRTGAWTKAAAAKKITATPADVQAISKKMQDKNSPAHWKSVPKRTPKAPSNEHDNYLKGTGVETVVTGKAIVARPTGAKAALDKAYGYIDPSKLGVNESGSNKAARSAFESKYIKAITPPYQLFYGNSAVKSVRVHKSVGGSLVAAMKEILAFYGADVINRLGINQYDGAFVYRKMRGSNSPSIHAYGCAIDFAASMNGLGRQWNGGASLFHQAPYAAFIDIMEKYGWYNQGRATGNDYMHFQAAAY